MLKDCVSERNRSGSATQKALGAAAETRKSRANASLSEPRFVLCRRNVRFFFSDLAFTDRRAFLRASRHSLHVGNVCRAASHANRCVSNVFLSKQCDFFFLPLINDFPLSRALNLCVFWQTNLGANQFCTVKIEIMTFCGFSLQRGNRIYSLVRGDACRYSPSTICKWQNFSLSHGSFSSSHNKQK